VTSKLHLSLEFITVKVSNTTRIAMHLTQSHILVQRKFSKAIQPFKCASNTLLNMMNVIYTSKDCVLNKLSMSNCDYICNYFQKIVGWLLKNKMCEREVFGV
jgi:hypothetical protein